MYVRDLVQGKHQGKRLDGMGIHMISLRCGSLFFRLLYRMAWRSRWRDVSSQFFFFFLVSCNAFEKGFFMETMKQMGKYDSGRVAQLCLGT